MSVLLYIASDTPLAEVKNPQYKTLSVNEALAAGMNDIPDFMLEPEFDRDCPGVLLWSDTEIKIDTDNNSFDDGQLDDDIIRHAIPIDALTPEVLERIESLDISIDTPTQHCFVLSK